MPVKCVPAATFFQYKGVAIYHVYVQNDIEEGYYPDRYSFDPHNCSECEEDYFTIQECIFDLGRESISIKRSDFEDESDYYKSVIIASLENELIINGQTGKPPEMRDNQDYDYNPFRCPECGGTTFSAYFEVNMNFQLLTRKEDKKYISKIHGTLPDATETYISDDQYTCTNCGACIDTDKLKIIKYGD